MKNLQIPLLLSFLGILLAFWLSKHFFLTSLEMVKTEGVSFSTNRPMSQFFIMYNPFFIIAVGLIPLWTFLVMKLTKINSVKHSIIVTGIIIISGLMFWQLRVQFLIDHFVSLSSFAKSIPEAVYSEYNIADLKFGDFLALGILIGVVQSFLYLKIMNRKSDIQTIKD